MGIEDYKPSSKVLAPDKYLDEIKDIIQPFFDKDDDEFISWITNFNVCNNALSFADMFGCLYDGLGLKDQARRFYQTALKMSIDPDYNHDLLRDYIIKHLNSALNEMIPDFFSEFTEDEKFSFLKKLDHELLMNISHTTRYIYQARIGHLEKNNMRNLSWGGYLQYNPSEELKRRSNELLAEFDAMKKMKVKDFDRMGPKQIEIEMMFLKMFTDYAKSLNKK